MNITVELADGSVMTLHDEDELRAFLRVAAEVHGEPVFDGSTDEVAVTELDDEDLEQPPCPHRTVYASGPRNGQCTLCGELVEESESQFTDEIEAPGKPPTPYQASGRYAGARVQIREFNPIGIPARHLVVMTQILGRRERGISVRRLEILTGCETREVRNAINWLKKHELIERVTGHWRWRPTAKAKAHDLVAA